MNGEAGANGNKVALNEEGCPEPCGENAMCSLDESGVLRCQCNEGFIGDGRLNGIGCGEFTRSRWLKIPLL